MKPRHALLGEGEAAVEVRNGGLHALPFVVSLPHSGVLLTQEMARSLKEGVVLANMDWYLPMLYDFLEEMGFTVLINRVSRYVIDPNRDLRDLDAQEYSRAPVYTATTFGRRMYDAPPGPQAVRSRIARCYDAYHTALRTALERKIAHFGSVTLLDLHSFGKRTGPDAILGDGDGRTMDEARVRRIQSLFAQNGFEPALNQPFRGGYITRHYGHAGSPCQSLQIELAYDAYIGRREFGEEEFPRIDPAVMNACRGRLKTIFTALLDGGAASR